jgi:hypothetical protein
MFVSRKIEDGAQKLDEAGYAEGIRQLVKRMDEAGSSTLLTGSVQLVGLSKIREKLGSAWDAIAVKAAAIAEEEIGRRLGETDIYKPDADGYLICFDTLDEAGAARIAHEISEDIEARLIEQLGELRGEDLGVSSFVAKVPMAAFRSSDNPTEALKAALEQIRLEVESAAKDRSFGRILKQSSIFFQPIWASQEHGKTQNRCVLDPLSGTAVSKYLEEIDDREEMLEALANLDCIIFTKSVEGLHRALKVMKRATVLVPVHFHTLTGELNLDLVSLGASAPASYRKFLVLDVIGVPASAGVRELVRAAKVANQITDRVVFQISPTEQRVTENFLELLWGVSHNLGDLNAEDPAVQRELVRFTACAAEAGLQSFAYGVSTLGRAMGAVRASFDYVGGSAVHNTVPVPRPQSRFSPIFGDLIAKMRKTDQGATLRTHARFAPVNPNAVLTLPGGERQHCKVNDVSASGAAIVSNARPAVGSIVAVGSLPSRVVRELSNGFAVQFLEIQKASLVEAALLAPLRDRSLLHAA